MTEVSLDTSRVPDGEHHVRLILTDVAGNTAIADDCKITVKNATQPTALSAGSETAPGSVVVARPRQRVAHKTPVQVLGYVHDPTGGPIAGARVRFLVRDGVEGSAFAPEQAIVSDVDGKVELQLPPGVSRVVQLMYRDSVATQSIVVPAPVRLRISPKRLRNGQSIRLTGSVPGTTAGTRVELQARAGGKWVPFRSAALRNGAFAARYRFTRTFSRTTYRFRAVIHSDPHFPYAAAASPVVKVRVRP